MPKGQYVRKHKPLPNPKKPVIVQGVSYDSVVAAVRETGLSRSTLWHWLAKGEKAQYVVASPREGTPEHSRHVSAPPVVEAKASDTALDPTQWPRYVFHRTEPPTLVQTPEGEAALGHGWRRTPFAPEESEPSPEVTQVLSYEEGNAMQTLMRAKVPRKTRQRLVRIGTKRPPSTASLVARARLRRAAYQKAQATKETT